MSFIMLTTFIKRWHRNFAIFYIYNRNILAFKMHRFCLFFSPIKYFVQNSLIFFSSNFPFWTLNCFKGLFELCHLVGVLLRMTQQQLLHLIFQYFFFQINSIRFLRELQYGYGFIHSYMCIKILSL